VNMARVFGILAWVEVEQNRHDLLPVRPIRVGVEQAQIERRLRLVILRQHRAFRRFIEQSLVCHLDPPCCTVGGILLPVNW
jgi:hypothetical protein